MNHLPIYNSVQSYLNLFISEYGYPIDQLSKDWQNWMTTKKDTERSAKDFVWSMFNIFIIRVSKGASSEAELYKYQTKINWDMMSFLIAERRDTTGVRRSLNRLALNTVALEDYKVDAVILADSCCVECQKADGKVYALNEAQRSQPIPHSGCVRTGGCNCMYVFRERRDNDGRIILK